MQGLADQALRLVEHTIEEGRANGHALTFCSVLGQGACPITFLAGDFDAAERYGELLFEHTERHAIRLWRLWAGCFKGMVMAKRGNIDAGLRLLQNEIGRAMPGSCRASCLRWANLRPVSAKQIRSKRDLKRSTKPWRAAKPGRNSG